MELLLEKRLDEIKALILKADYKLAKALAARLRDEVKGDFEVDFTYAKLLGDYADELPPAEQKKLKTEAVRILEKLVRRMNGQPADVRFGVRINFYYQTRRFKDLEKVGRSLIARNRVKGVVCGRTRSFARG